MLDLFFDQNLEKNYLPYDGEVNYFGKVFDLNESDLYLKHLLDTIHWEHDSVKIFGKTHIAKRKMAWYSTDNQSYTYSNSTKAANIFTDKLLEIKSKIEKISGENYNACLLNLYHNGEEGMGWHADNEPEIVKHSTIASISFGVERKFSFKHRKTKETISLNLENGSLIVMKGEIQDHWLHALPKTTKANGIRINLTFRIMKKPAN